MRDENPFNNRRKGALSWIFGAALILIGISIYESDAVVGIAFILIGIFVVPIVQNFVDKNLDISRSGKYLIVIGSVGLALYVGYSNQVEEEKRADKIVDESIEAISSQNFARAKILLRRAKKMYSNSENPASKVENTLEDLNSSSFVNSELVNLSEVEFKELKDGNLSKSILNNEKLNSVLIAKMQESAGSRAELLIEKEKREELERERELERQKEARVAAREKKIEDQFSAWNGSHRNLEDYIEKNMHDPDSYEHVETVYWDQGDHLVVKTTFRGNNAFGGKVKNFVRAKVSLDGEILEILDQ